MCRSHLRYDTLAQMLTLANIHAGSKVLVFETCAGLVLGSIMERMGGKFLLLRAVVKVFFLQCFVLLAQIFSLIFWINTLCLLLIQAMDQWSKCTQGVGQCGREWRVLAFLRIFTTRCMSFPSATSTLSWQELWTPVPKTPLLVGLAFFLTVFSR